MEEGLPGPQDFHLSVGMMKQVQAIIYHGQISKDLVFSLILFFQSFHGIHIINFAASCI